MAESASSTRSSLIRDVPFEHGEQIFERRGRSGLRRRRFGLRSHYVRFQANQISGMDRVNRLSIRHTPRLAFVLFVAPLTYRIGSCNHADRSIPWSDLN
ncbi:hypothetical protein VNO77_03404 [Canavalia gladiata]|uniref:Uncharacterized protein n=1 Tax=Canavalia gladiata TaxID=3824 RepID=A0AAN9MVG2_CANGL